MRSGPAEGDAEEAMPQLTVWLSAHQTKLNNFQQLGYWYNSVSLVVRHTWRAYYAYKVVKDKIVRLSTLPTYKVTLLSNLMVHETDVGRVIRLPYFSWRTYRP